MEPPRPDYIYVVCRLACQATVCKPTMAPKETPQGHLLVPNPQFGNQHCAQSYGYNADAQKERIVEDFAELSVPPYIDIY